MKRPTTQFNWQLGLLLAISVVMRSIRITVSKPFGPESLLRGKGIEVGESSRNAAKSDPGSSLSETDDHSYQHCEEVVQTCDGVQITGRADPRKEGQLLSPNEKRTSRGIPRVGEKMESQVTKRRKITILPSDIPEQVRLIKNDYNNLKNSLFVHKKRLVKIYTSTNPNNAHQVLKGILAELYRFVCIWSGGKDFQKLPGTCFFDLSDELQKKIVFHLFEKKLETFKDLLVNRRLKGGFFEHKYSHALEVQVFFIISFLVKHELLREEVIEKWINNDPILGVIEQHINSMYSSRYFLSHNTKSIFFKSQSSEHLHLPMKLFDEKSWKHVDYEYLKNRILSFTFIDEAAEKRFSILKSDFLLAGFDKTEADVKHKKEIFSKDLIVYLDCIDSTMLQVNVIHQIELLYEMLNFVAEYHYELFYNSFDEKRRAEEFSHKMKVIELAQVYLKSARDVEYFSKVGLWTTEIDARNSGHLISLEEAYNWSWLTRPPDEFFKIKFGIFYPRDEFTWNKILFNSALKKGVQGEEHVFNVGSLLPFWHRGEYKYFGSNFLFNPSLKKTSERLEDKKISILFLKEAYQWMDNLHFLYNKLIQSKNFFVEETEKLSGLSNEITSQNLKAWLKDSKSIRIINSRIFEHCFKSQRSWDRFSEKIHFLNIELFKMKESSSLWQKSDIYSNFPRSSTKKRITRNSLKASSGDSLVQLSKSQVEQGFQLPMLKFNLQTP